MDRSSGKRPKKSSRRSNKARDTKALSNPIDPKGTRLNKYIANAGVCSRREADELIKDGKIKVNDKVVTTMGYLVQSSEQVAYEGKLLRRERLVYVLLNKPKDYITTTNDPGQRKTVMQLVATACTERIVPVGRLDRNTTGLLLFTNDGDLTKKLSHPSFEVRKLYHVQLDRAIKKNDFEQILKGLMLDDGPIKIDALEIVSADNKELGIEIHSGRNRVVRRMFEHLGYDVVKLDRVMFAGLTKKDLPRGKWRLLTQRELVQLKHMDRGALKKPPKRKAPE